MFHQINKLALFLKQRLK